MLNDNIKYNEQVKPNTAFLNELKDKLPEFFTADKYDNEGNVIEKGTFDLEKFQSHLKENNIEEFTSGYQLDFIGKDYAKKQAGEFSKTVIVPDLEHNQLYENKDSKNLFFTGDNLEVLRHLQKNYSNTVDMIYIDPPYNTGSDGFVYPDKFEYSDENLKNMFGMSDDELKRLKSIQGKATHSAWLTFIYPRLWLAKKVLKESGLIFVSIDDNEQANLKILMDDIFGEGSFVCEIAWRRSDNQPNIGKVARVKEYILCFCKNPSKMKIGKLPLSDSAIKEYRYEDEKGKFRRGILLHKTRGRHFFDVKTKKGNILTGPWMVTEEKFKELDAQNLIYWTSGGEEQPYSKIYLLNSSGAIPNDFWGIEFGTNQRASLEIETLFNKRVFSFPKSTILVKTILQVGSNKNSIILDFFGGSGTTADAVMQLNAEDGGNRQFIMVQIPEKTFTLNENGEKKAIKSSETAFNEGFMSIDEITRKRIILSSKKIQDDGGLTLPEKFDGGFKHYYVVEPKQPVLDDLESFDLEAGLFKNSQNQLVQMPESGFDNMIKPFSAEDLSLKGKASGIDTIITTWMVSDGYKFDTEISSIEFAGYQAYYIDNNRLYLIDTNWGSKQTQELLNAIGTNKLTVQTIVIYSYSFDLESIKEIEIGLKQLDNKVNILKRY